MIMIIIKEKGHGGGEEIKRRIGKDITQQKVLL